MHILHGMRSIQQPSKIAGKKAGILPKSHSSSESSCTIQPSIPVSSLLQLENSSLEMNPVGQAESAAERQVEAALDALVATGALQKTNRMASKPSLTQKVNLTF